MGAEAEVVGGGTPKTNRADYFGGDIPWITPADLSGYEEKYISAGARNITQDGLNNSGARLMPAGTVLFSSRAPIGYVAIAANPVSTNQGFKSFVLRDGLTSDFVYYYLQHAKKLALELSSGTTFQEISGKNAARLPIPVPPLADQQQIVAEIEKQFICLDAGVAALRRVQANLKRYRAAVLKAACEGHLVPTEAELAKAEGRSYETGEQLLARILADRRKNWHGRGKYKEPAIPDTINLPPLPEGWTWATVEQLAAPELNSITDGPFGSNLKTAHYTNHGSRVVRLQNIGDGIFIDVRAYISNERYERLQKHRVFPGDVLIAALGENLPRCCIAPDGIGSAIVKADCIRLKPHRDVLSHFLNVALNSDPVRRRTEKIVHGVGRPRLNLAEIKSIVVPLPPLIEQTRIVADVERRLSVIEELETTVTANLQRAAGLRQSVLARAFSSKQVTQEQKNSNNDVLDLKAERRKRHFARAVLSAEIVHRLHDEPTFGRVKHQKIFHLCEHIAQIDEIQGQYHREAAGPLDNKLIYANEAELKKQKWYEEVRRTQYGHTYRPLARAGSHRKYIERYWSDKLSVVERLIEVMRHWSTDQCEMFSTVYAAWNDLLINGKSPSEANILHEILDCWHENKKRFSRERWKKVIKWMKQEHYTPTGFGKATNEISKSAI